MLLELDFSLETPIYKQIRDQIVMGIAQGKLKPGDRMPAVRTLADECGVNTMTVSKAYQLLKQEGRISADRRGGTVVCDVSGNPMPEVETMDGLKLRIAELKADGMKREQAESLCMKICGEIYAGKDEV